MKTIYSILTAIVIFSILFITSKSFQNFMISNHVIELLKIFTPILIALLVYQYTNDNHKKTLLNELDSKSEWRKKLFDIAGKEKIEIGDVFQLRAGVRFTEKDFKNLDTYFDKMNFVIIQYCKLFTKENDIKTLAENTSLYEDKKLTLQAQETIRLFCRYLLADHWEKNQNSKFIFSDQTKESELYDYTLTEFLKLQNIHEYDDLEDALNRLWDKLNK
ncbi:hypothetical protein [Staphylococcus argenteus]|uniref:hypothetical protein n=1 Tax=Staphylococcus argenteus TaxID=985002 RepID=UPI001FB8A706|nr:hypothetical protein [Staphylococcus argenteus]GJF55138.1 hypothetical protein SA19088_18810 [Staphylococcus argenteus]GJF93886.1 hypothetical protein SASC210_19700 [Staphylococcus argenteus]GJF96563.1 hypothetical protein SASC252_20220 [Staphylococcus argenteus]GJF99305.1 hypothetical protein SASC253_21030 [Staphylococcus argenteus]GJG01898.1 hypothetical protein SASC254_20600 [Staphylococcus argenteus]